MPKQLDDERRAEFERAIHDYSFPPALFDFAAGVDANCSKMQQVEDAIRGQLTSGDPSAVKDGLSNILYWGYAQSGYRWHRVEKFRSKVSPFQLAAACELLQAAPQPPLLELKQLSLPQFSGLSFISKIRMFLDPVQFATLDLQIMKIHRACPETVLKLIKLYPTSIPVNRRNALGYESWCSALRAISHEDFSDRYRATDIERGLFNLVQTGRVRLAADILNESDSL